jgi:hypothetical protein
MPETGIHCNSFVTENKPMSDIYERLVAVIPRDLKQQLELVAKNEHRSIAKQVAFILEEWLEDYCEKGEIDG